VLLGAAIEGETLVVLGGFLAHQGVIDVRGVALAAFVGSFVADQLWFWIGRSFADGPFVTRQRARPLFARALAQVEAHPVAFILGFRFIYGLRTVSPMAVGVSRVPVHQFLILNLIAALAWALLVTAIGWVFGQTAELFLGRLGRFEHELVAGLAAAIAASVVIYAVKRRASATIGPPSPPRKDSGLAP
jgi:membrane protein DedA with SNARE-associated domain